jgi:hypothetical protein
LDTKGYERGAIVDIDTVWRLARAWYVDPRTSSWAARTREESQAVLGSVGLNSGFWTLPG